MELSPFDPTIIASISSDGIQISKSQTRLHSLKPRKGQHLTCLNWSPSSKDPNCVALAVGTNNGLVHIVNVVGPHLQPAYSFAQCGVANKEDERRGMCRAVCWGASSKLAAGFDNGTGGISSAMRDNVVVIWDINNTGSRRMPLAFTESSAEELQSSSIVVEKSSGGALAHAESVFSMKYDPDRPDILAFGTQRCLYLWDTRQKLSTASKFIAHETGAVLGLEFCPMRPHCVATFSDGNQ